MDVQSAIIEYRRLSPQIFRPSVTRYIGSNIAKTAVGMAWFNGETLEEGGKGIVRDRLSWKEKESLGAGVADARLVPSIERTWKNSCKTCASPCPDLLLSLINRRFRFFVCTEERG